MNARKLVKVDHVREHVFCEYFFESNLGNSLISVLVILFGGDLMSFRILLISVFLVLVETLLLLSEYTSR